MLPKVTRFITLLYIRNKFSGKQAYWRSLQAFAKHLIYHRCALNIVNYEIIIQEDHYSDFMSHPDLSKFVKRGWLTLLLKGRDASRLVDGAIFE